MAKTDYKIKWITRTALCTALVLLAQMIGKLLSDNRVTGQSCTDSGGGKRRRLVGCNVRCDFLDSGGFAWHDAGTFHCACDCIRQCCDRGSGLVLFYEVQWYRNTCRRRCARRGSKVCSIVADGSHAPGNIAGYPAKASTDVVSDVLLAAVCDCNDRRHVGADCLSGSVPIV